MTEFESGSWCNYFSGFLDDQLVNFKCPRAVRSGCYADPKCPHTSYALLVDGVRVTNEIKKVC